MSSLITSQELTTNLEMSIPNCSNLNIISAFVSKPAVSWLKALIGNTTVCIVGRFSPNDFIQGASDIEAVKQCVLSGYTVKCLPNLHAKIYQIDDDLIFTGSANMTGKGLALVEVCNLEACTKVESTKKSKEFICKTIDSSIELTLTRLDKMQAFIENLSYTDVRSIPESWPEDVIPKIQDIFVSDFPLTKPGGSCDIYKVNSSLEFAILESNKNDFEYAQTLFKNSKAYSWITKILLNYTEERSLSFGKVSSMLHDTLSDDPAPYRSEIKDIQTNLYEYMSLYASDEIEIYVPGRKSQIIRLI